MLTSALIDLYLRWCEQHRSPKTVSFYRARLKLLGARHGDREFSSLTSLDVFELLTAAGVGMSDSTRRHNAVALESLQSFALTQHILDKRIFERLEKPRVGQRTRIMTATEVAQLLERASPQFLRIYSALRQCGARPGELCGLTIADWNREAQVIVIAQHKTARKTGKPRRIPVGAKLQAILLESIGERTEGPLFVNPSGKAWTPENLTQTFARLRKAAKLPAGLVLYLARHEFGTKLCKQKGIKFAADLLGHANTRTTERYVHLEDGDLRDAQDLVS